MADRNDDLPDLVKKVNRLRKEVTREALTGSVSDEKHAELASIVSRYQSLLRPYTDGLPNAAAIDAIEDGEPAELMLLLDAIQALEDVAYDLGFYPTPPKTTTGAAVELDDEELFDSGILGGEEAMKALQGHDDTIPERSYNTTQADIYRVTTIIPYTADPELREYEVEHSELSALVAEIEDPTTAERLVNIEAQTESGEP